jgi:hypothetical protein
MTETIRIDVPRQGLGDELSRALATHGLAAEIVDADDHCSLRVRFAQAEHDRLLADAIGAIETYLSERMLPLVVQRADGGAVVRPPGD